MLLPPRALLALLLLAGPLVADEPPFSTELRIGFGYEGSAAERPVVVLDGPPSSACAYSADERAQTIDVGATRGFSPIPFDGRAPLALLPYLARSSSVTARFALTGADRDSFGALSGLEQSLEVRLEGDRTLREADLSAEWFVGRGFAVRGAFEYGIGRETAGSTSVERPSGRADVSTSGVRASGATGLAVDASGSYALTTSSSDLGAAPSGPIVQARVIAREAAVEATWFATRRLGVSAGFDCGTRDVSSGSPGRLRASRSETARTFSSRVRWFASERVWAVLPASRTEIEEIEPPDSPTYQLFEETAGRVTLGAGLRF